MAVAATTLRLSVEAGAERSRRTLRRLRSAPNLRGWAEHYLTAGGEDRATSVLVFAAPQARL